MLKFLHYANGLLRYVLLISALSSTDFKVLWCLKHMPLIAHVVPLSYINKFILFILQKLIWPSISYLHGNFQFYRLKELWWIDNSSEGYNSDALISFLKLCPALEQLFVTVSFFNRKKNGTHIICIVPLICLTLLFPLFIYLLFFRRLNHCYW